MFENLTTRTKVLLGVAAVALIILLLMLQGRGSSSQDLGQSSTVAPPDFGSLDLPQLSIELPGFQRLALSDWELPEMYRPVLDCGCGEQLEPIGNAFASLGSTLLQ